MTTVKLPATTARRKAAVTVYSTGASNKTALAHQDDGKRDDGAPLQLSQAIATMRQVQHNPGAQVPSFRISAHRIRGSLVWRET
jgi:hypothetical protein